MATNYESVVINGQLVPVAPAQAFDPLSYGNSLSGPGFWPRGGQWNMPPLLPSAMSQTANTQYSPSDSGSGGVAMPTQGSMNGNGKVNFLHPTKSPVIWTLGTLALALFMLHKVHYGK